jgi:hypothetical protein
MINNPWINRAAVLVVLAMIYAAGHHDGALKAHHQHAACQEQLKK